MRRAAILAFLLLLSAAWGCNVSDALFGVLGDHYSGGGTTAEDRKYDYDREVERWDAYRQYGESP